MNNAFRVTIVMPVFNEDEIIEDAVRTNMQVLSQFNCNFEIILVNDGSTDSSPQIINQFFSNLPEIKIIHKKVNEGFGSAVKLGIEAATKDFILCVPSDSPLTSEVLKAFIDAAERADIIVSYRLKRLGYSWRMHLNSRVFHFLVNTLFNIPLRDFNWIHMYQRRIFENGVKIKSKGIFMLAEVLISSKRRGYTFYEIPVRQTQRITGTATASKLSTIFKTLKEILAYYRLDN